MAVIVVGVAGVVVVLVGSVVARVDVVVGGDVEVVEMFAMHVFIIRL